MAVTADGRAVAMALPGFGIVHRADPTQPFGYVCDALLFPHLTLGTPSMVFHDDGSLLVGGAGGVRLLGADGCPRSPVSELADATVIAMAAQPAATETVYAAVAGSKAGLWRSSDGGRHWQLRSALIAPELVTGLVVSPDDPDRLYLSKDSPPGSLLLVSSNGGESFDSYPQEIARTLLSAQGGSPERLWVRARDAQSVGNRGFAILRADSPQGPWQALTRIAYFGGFVIGADGVISIGDELGGVARSSDQGATFQQLNVDVSIASLAQAGSALWAGTIGLPQHPALQTMAGDQPFTSVVALSQVERLVSCGPELQVERVCAAAWGEWQRDVLMRPPPVQDAGVEPSDADAAVPEEAGADAEIAGGEAGVAAAPAMGRDSSGCTLGPATGRAKSWAAAWFMLGVALVRCTRRRDQESDGPTRRL